MQLPLQPPPLRGALARSLDPRTNHASQGTHPRARRVGVLYLNVMDVVILILVAALGFYVGYLGGARHIVNFFYRSK